MPERDTSFVPMISAAFFLAATMAATTHGPARADSTCIEQPNQPAPEGSRWSSRFDRAKGRKCWSLTDVSANGHDGAAAPQGQPSAAPTLSSRLSSLLDSLTGASTTAAPQATVPQSTAPQGSATTAPRKPQVNSAIVARTETGQRNIGEVRAGTRVPVSMTQSERNALFEEFLQWRDSQPANVRVNSGAAPP